MNLNSVLIGRRGPEAAWWTTTPSSSGPPAGSEGGYTWWQLGTGGFTVPSTSEVKGKNPTRAGSSGTSRPPT